MVPEPNQPQHLPLASLNQCNPSTLAIGLSYQEECRGMLYVPEGNDNPRTLPSWNDGLNKACTFSDEKQSK